jgi:hypothetical protein
LKAALLAGLAGVALALPWASSAEAQVSPEQATELGREAYRYGLPLLEFLRVRAEMTSVRAPDGRGNAPVNTFSHARGFARPRDRTVVAPNVDTLYSIAHLDLAKGPVLLSHPAMGRRFFGFQFLDPYTNVIGYAGTRTTGRGAGRVQIAWTRRPGKREPGAKLIRSRYRRVWVIGRTLATDSRADQRRARAKMLRYRLRPGPRLRSRRPGRPRKAPLPTDGLELLDALGRALAQNPPPPRDRPLLERLAGVGVGPGLRPSEAGLSADVLAALRDGVEREAAEAPTRARADVARQAIAAGGWLSLDPKIGNYGTDYDLRATVALVGLGANTPAEAIYPTALADGEGAFLTGANRYRLVFGRGEEPPTRAFWSLTMYDSGGYLVPNPTRRYAIGTSHPPLVRRRDGSIVVLIQRERPAARNVNWLPAPAGGFRLNLRLYWPRRAALTGAWRPPPVQRLG